MYLHSLRKMYLPKSKPGDVSPLGMSWNDLNIVLISAEGGLFMACAFMVILGQDVLASLLLIIAVGFMAASKDNFWMESDVSAIKREKGTRLERISRDVSVLGVAVMLMGGYMQTGKKAKVTKSE